MSLVSFKEFVYVGDVSVDICKYIIFLHCTYIDRILIKANKGETSGSSVSSTYYQEKVS